MKKLKYSKWIALPLSLLLAFNATVCTSIAYVVTRTGVAVNTFVPFESVEGDLVISKTVEHPYGADYVIPEHIKFDFQVELGALYADYTFATNYGDVTADANGTLLLSVRPGAPVGIEGIDEDTAVTVTELPTSLAGFTVKNDQSVKKANVTPDEQVILDFVNVYTPTSVKPVVTVEGEKILKGREWQEGDSFEFLLERENNLGEWSAIGTRTAAYSADDPAFTKFSFSDLFEGLEFTQIGTYAYRMREIDHGLENITYDTAVNRFEFLVTDEDMDGSLEVKDIIPTLFAQTEKDEATGAYAVNVTFTNVYSEESTTESTTTAATTSTPDTTTTSTDTTQSESTTVTSTTDTTASKQTTTTTTDTETTPKVTSTTASSTTKATTTTSVTSTTKATTTTSATSTTKATTTTSATSTTMATTSTSATSTTEATTTTESTTTAEPAATWTIGKVDAHAGDTGVVVPITVTGDTGLISYIFDLLTGDGLNLVGAEAGNAYAPLEMAADLIEKHFGGTNITLGENIIAEDGSVVINLIFDIPADLEPGKYPIEFAGDVNAQTFDGIPLNITEESGYINILPPDITVTGYRYEVEGKDKFYFAHDPRPFIPEDLIATITRFAQYSDGTEGEGVIVSDWSVLDIVFDIEGFRNAEEVYKTQILDENGEVREDLAYKAYYRGSIPCTIDGQLAETNATAYIAVKGDVTLDGMPDANDAATILVFAAQSGAGNEAWLYSKDDQMLEYFAYFLGDVTGESENYGADGSVMDANDAANILVYAAEFGAGLKPLWEVVLEAPLPIYTYEIAEFNGTLPPEKA